MLFAYKHLGFATTTLLLTLSSCAPPHVYKAYIGPTLGPSLIATVEGDNPSIQGLEGSGATIYIASIDGQTTIGDWTAPAVIVQILPGEHTFELGYREHSQSPDLAPYLREQQLLRAIDQAYRETIRFRVEGGAKYIISVDAKAKRFGVRKVGGGDVPVTVVGNS